MDEIPYIARLGDCWGRLCGSKEFASRWADRLIGTTRMAWSPDPDRRGYSKGTTNCLSALLAAERYDDLLELLAMNHNPIWQYRQYGVKALAAIGRKAEAIRYAEEGGGRNDNPSAIAAACEEVLLSSGLLDEAYRRYGLLANQTGTYAGWFRAVARKYPHKRPAEILDDLVAATPGDEGKWFAAAKDAELFEEAIALANRTPCSPQTLTRAARDFADERPEFAIAAGLAALRWLVEGHGYEITGLDVLNAYSHTMKAAENARCVEETRQRIRELVSRESSGQHFVNKMLGRHLGLL